MQHKELNSVLGNVDIYLLDQILKGRFDGKQRLLDAGCAEGRNLRYFINNNYEVHGVDINAMAIKMAQMTYKNVPSSHFSVSNLTSLPFEDNTFDAIICTAVLHFAASEEEFHVMLAELVRVLDKNGVMFIRMATEVGLSTSEHGNFTYLLKSAAIDQVFENHGLTFVEPWKSVVVEGKRSMGSFMLKKD
jgi:tellurite methyltransferase